MGVAAVVDFEFEAIAAIFVLSRFHIVCRKRKTPQNASLCLLGETCVNSTLSSVQFDQDHGRACMDKTSLSPESQKLGLPMGLYVWAQAQRVEMLGGPLKM